MCLRSTTWTGTSAARRGGPARVLPGRLDRIGVMRPVSWPISGVGHSVLHTGRGRSRPALNGKAHASVACANLFGSVRGDRDQAQ
jgi:hypothetical protein